MAPLPLIKPSRPKPDLIIITHNLPGGTVETIEIPSCNETSRDTAKSQNPKQTKKNVLSHIVLRSKFHHRSGHPYEHGLANAGCDIRPVQYAAAVGPPELQAR